MKPVLSVVIPTRNRQELLAAALRHLASLDAEDVEFVVEDNSDRPLDEAHRRDPRIRYRHDPAPRSMIENCEEATLRAEGLYVTLIGDDDTVSSEIVAAARWAAREGLDALSPTIASHYFWPDLQYRYQGFWRAGQLHAVRPTGKSAPIDPLRELERCLRSGAQNFHRLPRLYYGLIRREVLERGRERTGTYYAGVSPDLAGAAQAALHMSAPPGGAGGSRKADGARARALWLDYPLFLPGTSGRSHGGLGMMKRHVGRLEDQAHLPRAYVEDWPPEVPRFYSVANVWAESLVRALRASGREDLVRRLSLGCLLAHGYVFNLGMARELNRAFVPCARALGQPVPLVAAELAYHSLRLVALRARTLIVRKAGLELRGVEVRRNLRDIAEAAEEFERWRAERGLALERVLGEGAKWR